MKIDFKCLLLKDLSDFAKQFSELKNLLKNGRNELRTSRSGVRISQGAPLFLNKNNYLASLTKFKTAMTLFYI